MVRIQVCLFCFIINDMTQRLFIICFFSFTLFSSCVSHRNLILLNEKKDFDKKQKTFEFNNNIKEYKMQKYDLISINVLGLDIQSNSFFNKKNGGSDGSILNEISLYLESYSVDSVGNIKIPLIGNIKVIDKTSIEIEKVLQPKFDEYYKNAHITVKLVNYRVTVLGEVKLPGSRYIYHKNNTILDAIGDARGFTTYANMKRIKLIRTSNNKRKVYKVDMRSLDAMNSEFYNLQPSDIIYVEPSRYKSSRLNLTNASLAFSSVSYILLFYQLLKP